MAYLDEMNIGGTDYTIQDNRISTTAVTTATHLLATNSGVTSIAPITAANLASVLGVPNRGTYEAGEEDSLVNYGLYRSPWHNAYGHRYIVVFRNNTFIQQISYDRLEIRIRTSNNTGSAWTDWSGIPTGIASFYTNYSDLASLASALGGESLMYSLGKGTNNEITVNANSVDKTCWIRVSNSSTNLPTQNVNRGSHLLTLWHGSDYQVQFYFDRGGDTYKRAINGSTWSSWIRVYDESILTNQTLLSPLASALGAIRYIGAVTSSNIDSKTEPGVYSHGDSVSGDGGYGLVLVFGQSDGYLAQIDFMFYSGRVKWRNRASSSSSWGNWKEFQLLQTS